MNALATPPIWSSLVNRQTSLLASQQAPEIQTSPHEMHMFLRTLWRSFDILTSSRQLGMIRIVVHHVSRAAATSRIDALFDGGSFEIVGCGRPTSRLSNISWSPPPVFCQHYVTKSRDKQRKRRGVENNNHIGNFVKGINHIPAPPRPWETWRPVIAAADRCSPKSETQRKSRDEKTKPRKFA
jgi:hypothetical protein